MNMQRVSKKGEYSLRRKKRIEEFQRPVLFAKNALSVKGRALKERRDSAATAET